MKRVEMFVGEAVGFPRDDSVVPYRSVARQFNK